MTGFLTGKTRAWVAAAVLALIGAPLAAAAAEPSSERQAICQAIADAAAANGLPSGFLARLLWTESGFRNSATSPAGAEGVAQFMPQTAAERGLADPRDPAQAIRHAARLLAELDRQFGNLGLAAAAYNAGALRVTHWLQGTSALPIETRLYVLSVTGRQAEDWVARRGGLLVAANAYALPGLDCLNVTASLARRGPTAGAASRLWQVRLDSHLANAIAVFAAASHRDDGLEASLRAARVSSDVRAAKSLCAAIRARGAACSVFGR